jgi:hypothetical protein
MISPESTTPPGKRSDASMASSSRKMMRKRRRINDKRLRHLGKTKTSWKKK